MLISKGAAFWDSLRRFSRSRRLLREDDERALLPACKIPEMIPTDRQAKRLMQILDRAEAGGLSGS